MSQICQQSRIIYPDVYITMDKKEYQYCMNILLSQTLNAKSSFFDFFFVFVFILLHLVSMSKTCSSNDIWNVLKQKHSLYEQNTNNHVPFYNSGRSHKFRIQPYNKIYKSENEMVRPP